MLKLHFNITIFFSINGDLESSSSHLNDFILKGNVHISYHASNKIRRIIVEYATGCSKVFSC
jgi:hypothetical protein